MNKTTIAILLIVSLVFASNFKQHFSQVQAANEKVQLLTQANQKKLDKLNAQGPLNKQEKWLQQHLSNSLDKNDLVQQGSKLTLYSLISMFSIMLLGAAAFVWAQRRSSGPARSSVADINCAPPSDNKIAQQLSWQAMGSLASNFSPQTIKLKSKHMLRISSSAQWIIFASTFALLGISAFGFALYKSQLNEQGLSLGLGLPFMAAGIGLLVYGYMQGWLIDNQAGLVTSPLHGQYETADIVALQFITGIAGGRHRIFNVYEINMVLKDARRVTLLRHSNQDNAMRSAALLSGFLQLPVWQQ